MFVSLEIPYKNPLYYFDAFKDGEGSVLLHSAMQHDQFGRYSFIVADPFDTLVSREDAFFSLFSEKIAKYGFQSRESHLPFWGGAVGYLSYDLVRQIEKLPALAVNDADYADAVVGFYDGGVVFDHRLKKAWIVAHGAKAKERLSWFEHHLFHKKKHKEVGAIVAGELRSGFTAETYQSSVQKIRDYILQGDVFEVNLSQRFSAPVSEDFDAWQLYHELVRHNPAPFSAYLNTSDAKIISASPERFLKCQNGCVETRPIKGTIKRSKNKVKDAALAESLLGSEKDRSENAMIVDLLRNDLSKVCLPHSVKVPTFCGLESYATVHHLVSVVEGELRQEKTPLDLLSACFPGGSITGAPKIRAMEIIEALEPTRRGPYCGSVFYYDVNGSLDSSIVIRTFVLKNKHLSFQAGGAVVLDSDPAQEYEESLLKVQALKNLVKQHDFIN